MGRTRSPPVEIGRSEVLSMPTDNPELLASIRGPNNYPLAFSHYGVRAQCGVARTQEQQKGKTFSTCFSLTYSRM